MSLKLGLLNKIFQLSSHNKVDTLEYKSTLISNIALFIPQ